MVKCIEVIAARETCYKTSSDFNMLFQDSRRTFFRQLLIESVFSDRPQSGNMPKIIENVSYSIRYCKISLPTYLGSISLSHVWPFPYFRGAI